MSKIERRFIPRDTCEVEIEERTDDGQRKIVGYAAVFYDKSNPGTEYELMPGLRERIMPGAFDRAIAESDDAAALFNHDPNLVLGRVSSGTLKLESFPRKGLRYTIRPGDTTVAKDVAEHVRRRDVRGSSFSFTVDEGGQSFRSEKAADGSSYDVREIRQVSQLYDVGPVTFPAYGGTSTGMRSELSAEVRSAYEAWKGSLESEEQRLKDEAQKQADTEARLAEYRQRADSITA